MRGRSLVPLALGLVMLVAVVVLADVPASAQTPRRGGILTSLVIEDPPGFLIHEAATTSVLWPMVPVWLDK